MKDGILRFKVKIICLEESDSLTVYYPEYSILSYLFFEIFVCLFVYSKAFLMFRITFAFHLVHQRCTALYYSPSL